MNTEVKTEAEGKLLSRLYQAGTWEGISFLVLLGIAMPLKYLAEMPMAVRVVGSAHGILFIWYLVILYQCFDAKKVSFTKAAAAFGLAFLPFGTFFLKRALTESNVK